MQATRYEDAITIRTKTPDEIEEEMENPQKTNFSQFNYQFPNGVVCGVGKSKRPSHASLFQIIVSDFAGKPAFKFETEYAGEYTSSSRAEKHLRVYCKEVWEAAELSKTKQIRRSEAAKEADKKDVDATNPSN